MDQQAKNPPQEKKRIVVLDYVRALAIIYIIFYHYFLERFHGAFLITPDGIGNNLNHLVQFNDGGALGFLKNTFGILFYYGFTGVNLFLLLSGFVLTLGVLGLFEKGVKIEWLTFLKKRLKRILIPFYVSVLIGIGFLFLRNFLFHQFAAAPVYGWLDIGKLIVFPFLFFDYSLVQKFNGDYWFIPLIFQLYLIFPILALLLKKLKPWKFLGLMIVLSCGFRFVAGYYLDSVPMGVMYPSKNSYYLFGFFLSRMIEFAIGMAMAYWQFYNEKFVDSLTGWKQFIGGVLVTMAGFSLDMNRWGWAFSDAVIAIGLTMVFINMGALLGQLKLFEKFLLKISDVSYEVYLLHHYFLNYFLTPLLLAYGIQNELSFWICMPIFAVVSYLLGFGQNKLTQKLG